MKKFIADTHSHTNISIDGHFSADEMCAEAYKRGFDVFAISDHCDVNRDAELGCFEKSSRSIADAIRLKAEYAGKMQVAVGIEIGNTHRNVPVAMQCAAIDGIDCIIGSVHRIILDGVEYAGTLIKFKEIPGELVSRIINRYFEEIHLMLDCLHPDILAHPTYMLRYAVGHNGLVIDMDEHKKELDSVLERIINEGIALEVNTQITNARLDGYDRYMLERYYILGGRLLTLGSDAHTLSGLGRAFDSVRAELREIGFERACYVIDREKHSYEL